MRIQREIKMKKIRKLKKKKLMTKLLSMTQMKMSLKLE